jgi:predicted  nucleic acid-binding Zn-ribbon protein
MEVLMSEARQLYQLQLVDSEWDAKSARLADVNARLGVTDDVDRARQAVDEIAETLEGLMARLRALDLEVGGVSAKLKVNQDRLYGGKVRNPKELSSLQDEAAALRRRLSSLEDDQLELMIAVEEEEAESAERQARLRQIEETWKLRQEALQSEKGELELALQDLEEQRSALRPRISATTRSDYDHLRSRLGGTAVVLLKRGVCQACGVDVPTGMAQAAERGEGLHHCPICGRLLVAAA